VVAIQLLSSKKTEVLKKPPFVRIMAYVILIQEGVCATEDIHRVMEMVTRVCVEIVGLGQCLQRSIWQDNATVVGLLVWLRKLHLLFQTLIRRCNYVAPHQVHAQVRFT
jgi:hypothetical protein